MLTLANNHTTGFGLLAESPTDAHRECPGQMSSPWGIDPGVKSPRRRLAQRQRFVRVIGPIAVVLGLVQHNEVLGSSTPGVCRRRRSVLHVFVGRGALRAPFAGRASQVSLSRVVKELRRSASPARRRRRQPSSEFRTWPKTCSTRSSRCSERSRSWLSTSLFIVWFGIGEAPEGSRSSRSPPSSRSTSTSTTAFATSISGLVEAAAGIRARPSSRLVREVVLPGALPPGAPRPAHRARRLVARSGGRRADQLLFRGRGALARERPEQPQLGWRNCEHRHLCDARHPHRSCCPGARTSTSRLATGVRRRMTIAPFQNLHPSYAREPIAPTVALRGVTRRFGELHGDRRARPNRLSRRDRRCSSERVAAARRRLLRVTRGSRQRSSRRRPSRRDAPPLPTRNTRLLPWRQGVAQNVAIGLPRRYGPRTCASRHSDLKSAYTDGKTLGRTR